MEVLDKILTTTDKVITLLRDNPRLRDNHDALTTNYWFWELKKMGKNPKEMTGYELLQLISKGELTSEETIQRARRKAQHDDISLRGEKYAQRMEEEKDVRHNINS